jgi:SAM-dependent methyltransferase
MAPDPGKQYTVSCTLRKAVPDPEQLESIKGAALRIHRCTLLATDLLNLYVRDRIENHNATGLEGVFTQNWLLNAYYAVSRSKAAPKVDASVQAVFDAHMAGSINYPDRKGLVQALCYECKNLAAVGSTNVWMHFRKRVLSYARTCFALTEQEHQALTKDERHARKLAIMQAADDLCRQPDDPLRSPASYHDWVKQERDRLGIDTSVGNWNSKPLLYHLKAHPHRFVHAMYLMSVAQHSAGRKAFALFPLRRSLVPGHMRFDQKVLDDVLGLGAAAAAAAAKARIAKASGPDLDKNGRAPKRKRDDPTLIEEKASVFGQVLDLRAAGVHRRTHFAFAFTTDGVSLHLNMEKPGGKAKAAKMAAFPMRGIHSIDELKRVSRLEKVKAEDVHVVGIDPGKRELIVAVDQDDHKSVVRYTLQQRQKDMRIRQYRDEAKRCKPWQACDAEENLSTLNSKAPSLQEFARYAQTRRRLLREHQEIHDFYDEEHHRDRRRKTRIKAQQSEARVVNRLAAMHSQGDERRLVLAYGAWGLVAGRPNQASNKGTPPAIGAGLMKRLALHFVVAPTPEHYTSKTCVKCLGPCGPHPTLKTKEGKEIRGLRVCQHEGCGLFQNRDKTGASNIGLQFRRLLQDKGPIRGMSDEELEFHRLDMCTECCD